MVTRRSQSPPQHDRPACQGESAAHGRLGGDELMRLTLAMSGQEDNPEDYCAVFNI